MIKLVTIFREKNVLDVFMLGSLNPQAEIFPSTRPLSDRPMGICLLWKALLLGSKK